MYSQQIALAGIRENQAYAAGSVFATDITPQFRASYVHITVAVSAAVDCFFRLIGGATTNLALNNGSSLIPDTIYYFDVPIRPKAGSQDIAYNIRFGGATTIRYLMVEEISNGG